MAIMAVRALGAEPRRSLTSFKGSRDIEPIERNYDEPTGNSRGQKVPVIMLLALSPSLLSSGSANAFTPITNENLVEIPAQIPEENYEDAYFPEVQQQNLRKNYINGYLDPADVQYKKSFRMGGKNYTMYFVETGKAYRGEKNLVDGIFFIPDDYKYREIFGDANMPPDMVEFVYHDLGDPENKDFCSVVLVESVINKAGNDTYTIKKEVIIPDDIATDIINLYNGDTKFKLVGHLNDCIKEVKTTKLRKF